MDQQFLARHLVVGDNTVVTLRHVAHDRAHTPLAF
jgi:hypothetical protein